MSEACHAGWLSHAQLEQYCLIAPHNARIERGNLIYVKGVNAATTCS